MFSVCLFLTAVFGFLVDAGQCPSDSKKSIKNTISAVFTAKSLDELQATVQACYTHDTSISELGSYKASLLAILSDKNSSSLSSSLYDYCAVLKAAFLHIHSMSLIDKRNMHLQAGYMTCKQLLASPSLGSDYSQNKLSREELVKLIDSTYVEGSTISQKNVDYLKRDWMLWWVMIVWIGYACLFVIAVVFVRFYALKKIKTQ